MGVFSSKSKMKSMGEQSGFVVHGLEHKMYLFYPKDGTNHLIISAHGGHTLTTTNKFNVPTDTILRFYSEDKNSVLDPGFNKFYEKEAVPKEIISEGESCFDYVLTKYQGSHNKMGETYDSIAKTMNAVFKQRNALLADAAKAGAKGNTKAQDKMLNMAAANKTPAVLTIRNRHFRSDVNLSFALEQVKKEYSGIQLIDCLFCRSTLFGGSDAVKLVDRW